MSEDDPDRRMELWEWVLRELREGPNMSTKILFCDEANIYVNGEVNRQDLRYRSNGNLHWMSSAKVQRGGKVMVWARILGDRVIGPYFVDGNLNTDKYLIMSQEDIFSYLLCEDGNFPVFFQQDVDPSQFGFQVRQWLVQLFPGAWIGWRGPARSPDISPLDF